MDDWAVLQIWRQRNEELRREAETLRLARALRRGSARRSRWVPILWWELQRHGGRALKFFGRRRAGLRDH